MTWLLALEQGLNGVQLGLMLFLIAAGLTLVFGIMDMINLAHGSLYMIGAYAAASVAQASGSFALAVVAAIAITAVIGVLLETVLLRHFYGRDHLSQVLGTFALLLMINEAVRMIFGSQPIMLNTPQALSGPVSLLPGLRYPAYRLFVIGVGLAIALLLYVLVARTRTGMRVRAGASNREMATAMGVNVRVLFTALFGVGAGLCALAGAMLGPILSVQVGMGESVLILAFVVIVIGGIGSIRGALVGALLIGMVDTMGRALLPTLLRSVLPPAAASSLGPALASIAIYVLMAAILMWRPQGLFPARG
jgi:branched-chain amino acid transport system permease protein